MSHTCLELCLLGLKSGGKVLDTLVTSMTGSIVQGRGQQNICWELWVVLEQTSVILVRVVSSSCLLPAKPLAEICSKPQLF